MRFTCLIIAVAFLPTGRLMADEGVDFFEKKIRPVLVERCYQCHSVQATSIKGGLRLDTREAIRGGGDSGPIIVPQKPAESSIMAALRYEGLEMPPDGKVSEEIIADFEKWIEMGAPDPREGDAGPSPTKQIDWEQARTFWSFQPPRRPQFPRVSQAAWVRQPIDIFILAKVEVAGLEPGAAADHRTLIRRVYFDLIGLPPSAEEVEQFASDTGPLAYERLVDRLLASPQYGERWARLWLDISRYGEDQAHIVGEDRSLCYPNAYLYRDWVISALNSDLPYDEFIRRQLAADLIDPEEKSGHAALGFLGLGPKYYRRNAPEVMADEWEDRVDTVGRGLLGLTIACARCHDHKYDPISTQDYYALAGVFASVEMYNRPFDEKAELGKNGQAKDPEKAMHIVRDTEPHDLPVHIRGDAANKGPVVSRRFLRVLAESEPASFARGSGRLDLADAICDKQNPLTARVIVNRIWGQLLGRALVPTTSNFGLLGERPTHQELLDDLSLRFMEQGWSLKRLHREIVLSAAYCQSSEATPRQVEGDPANLLYSRMNRRRLSVEMWRDEILAIADSLELRLGGPSVDPQNPDHGRRTLYSEVSRLKLNPMLSLFDFPDPNAHSEGRAQTTTPLQKLFLLNSPFMARQAEVLSRKVIEGAADDAARLELSYRIVYARAPTADEIHLAQGFLEGCGTETDARWVQFVQALLASNELLFID